MWFELGGIKVAPQGALTFAQSYAAEEGSSVLRMMSGAAVKQFGWSKTTVTTSGTGRYPPGLDSLDYSQPMTMKCSQPREVTSSSNVITLPAARRTDAGFVPVAFALVTPAGGDAMLDPRWQPADVSLASNIATITPVSGALQYQVWYWPQITVFATRPTSDWSGQPAGSGHAYSWTLEAREV